MEYSPQNLSQTNIRNFFFYIFLWWEHKYGFKVCLSLISSLFFYLFFLLSLSLSFSLSPFHFPQSQVELKPSKQVFLARYSHCSYVSVDLVKAPWQCGLEVILLALEVEGYELLLIKVITWFFDLVLVLFVWAWDVFAKIARIDGISIALLNIILYVQT